MVKNRKRVEEEKVAGWREAREYHRRMYNELEALCRQCVIKDSQSCLCTKCKTDCIFYNMKIAQFVLEEYPIRSIKGELPIKSILRGVEAHGYSGALKQTKVVII